MDDDEDMADMYLTRRAAAEERRHDFYETARQSAAEQGVLCSHFPHVDNLDQFSGTGDEVLHVVNASTAPA